MWPAPRQLRQSSSITGALPPSTAITISQCSGSASSSKESRSLIQAATVPSPAVLQSEVVTVLLSTSNPADRTTCRVCCGVMTALLSVLALRPTSTAPRAAAARFSIRPARTAPRHLAWSPATSPFRSRRGRAPAGAPGGTGSWKRRSPSPPSGRPAGALSSSSAVSERCDDALETASKIISASSSLEIGLGASIRLCTLAVLIRSRMVFSEKPASCFTVSPRILARSSCSSEPVGAMRQSAMMRSYISGPFCAYSGSARSCFTVLSEMCDTRKAALSLSLLVRDTLAFWDSAPTVGRARAPGFRTYGMPGMSVPGEAAPSSWRRKQSASEWPRSSVLAPSWSRLRRNSRHFGPGTQSYCWKDSLISTEVDMLGLGSAHGRIHAAVSSRFGPGLAHHVPTKNIGRAVQAAPDRSWAPGWSREHRL